MRKLKYLLILVLSMTMLNSCFEDTTIYDLNEGGLNVVTLERIATNLVAEANGSEYTFEVKIKIVGPTVMDLANDVSVTFTATEASTAVEGVHYRINNNPMTLSADNSYLGLLSITLITDGNTPPMEGTPEFDAYVAPKLYMDIAASGDPMVTGSGKGADLTLNFTAPNPYAGDYDAHLIYRHPSLGDYPDNVYVDEVSPKTLVAVTGRKCETGFATWHDNLCWITINPDNSIKFEVDDTWSYDVKLGDPNRADLVSHFDPADGKIYLYYHYSGDGGDRIFWEVFTPLF